MGYAFGRSPSKAFQYAALIGMSTDKATSCMNDEEIENKIVAGIQSKF